MRVISGAPLGLALVAGLVGPLLRAHRADDDMDG
jgi:hypothetical protein